MFKRLEALAKRFSDGHFTVMRFSGNWRVCFHTIEAANRNDIQDMSCGKTFEEAATKAIEACLKDNLQNKNLTGGI